MDKKWLIVSAAVIVLVGTFLSYNSGQALRAKGVPITPTPTPPPTVSQLLNGVYAYNPLDKTMRVQLKNGKANLSPADNAAGTVTLGDHYAVVGNTYFTTATYNYGGSGFFVYLVAIQELPTGGWEMKDHLELGDRVKVTGIQAEGKTVRAFYLRHAEGQAMAVEPTEKVERIIDYVNGTFTQTAIPPAQ